MAINVNLNQLYTVYMVVVHGSISAAANALCVSPAAVTTHVKNLENWLNVQLFTRRKNTLLPSEALQEIMPQMTSAFETIENIDKSLRLMQEKREHTLHLGIDVVPAQFFFPPYLAQLREIAPHIQVQIVLGSTNESLQRLRNNEVQIVFFGGQNLQEKGIVCSEFTPYKVVFAVCAQRASEFGTVLDARELAHMPIMLPPLEATVGQHVTAYLQEHNIRPTHIMKNISTEVALKILPGSKYGAFFINSTVNRFAAQKNMFHIVQLEPPLPSGSTYLAHLEAQSQNHLLQQFLKAMYSILKKPKTDTHL